MEQLRQGRTQEDIDKTSLRLLFEYSDEQNERTEEEIRAQQNANG